MGAADLAARHGGRLYIQGPAPAPEAVSHRHHASGHLRVAESVLLIGTQSVRYDKTILVGGGHSPAVRLGSEPGSWSPNVEASPGEASTPGRRQGRPVDLKCPSAQAQITVIRRAPDPPAGPGDSFAPATPASELVQLLPVGQDSALHLGEGRSYRVIVLPGERCGQVLPEPVEMLADDPADLLIARGPVPAGRWRPAGRARHVRQRRHPEGLVLVREQPGPGPQVGEQLVEHRVEGVRPGDPPVRLPDVQDRVNDLAEHLVEGGDRVAARWRAHAATDARRPPPPAPGRATGSRHPKPRTSFVFAMKLLPGQPG
jgi:hypothetical protein